MTHSNGILMTSHYRSKFKLIYSNSTRLLSSKGGILGCVSNVFSDKIPVSDCALDSDNDGINNNVDIDNDNDGITPNWSLPNQIK
jgi:hypothetical protein